MSIRAKITLLVLAVGLSEAVLLGVIGYNSVATVSRNAAELRRIGSAIEGTRALNASLSRLTDPTDFLLQNEPGVRERFRSDVVGVERQVSTCSATTCHGYEKRPPQMASVALEDLRMVRANGERILAARTPGSALPWAAWAADVDGPARRVSRMTGEMAETLMAKARAIESESWEAEHRALFLVGMTSLFCVFVAVALCRPLARGITRPLETLADQSRRIAGGDLGRQASETGPREIVLLARSFNRMIDELARHRDGLLRHQEELERRVDERVGELRRKDEQLKRVERIAGIGLIAGTVAHDLNNPLTNVLLNAEALVEGLPDGDRNRRLVEDIMRDAQRCREIARDIRAMGREVQIESAPCEVGALAREAIRLLRYKWEPKRLAVRCEAPGDGNPCLCNATRVLQLLVNLVDNAVDASPEGAEVAVRLRHDAGALVVDVEDHGPGIPVGCRASLFKPFFTTKPEGTGLGLAVTRRIVEQHEGTIEVQTRTEGDAAGTGPDGHGTRIRVRLPLGASRSNGAGTASGGGGCGYTPGAAASPPGADEAAGPTA